MDSQFERIQIDTGQFRFDAIAAGPEDGPLVFLLHGFPQSNFEWRHQLPVLGGMGYRTVAPNQRGYSPGARPKETEAYRVSHLVGDVMAMADVLGRQTFHVIGHDWGAIVAWVAGIMHSDRVESIVPISVPHPAALAQALANPDGPQAEMSGYTRIWASEGSEDIFLADDAARLRKVFVGSGNTAEEIEEYVRHLSRPGALTGALNWYRATALGDAGPSMPSVTVPTMYIWSTDDIALGREAAELTANFVDGSYRSEILEGISHWVPEQAAEQLNQLLREHFVSLRS